MATQGNAATEKDGTRTASSELTQVRLRADAPRIRTAEELYRKCEQVFDATERGTLTPKQIDGLNTQIKVMKSLGLDMPLRLMALIAKFSKGGTSNLPSPRGEMLRTFLDLPVKPSSEDRKALTPNGLR